LQPQRIAAMVVVSATMYFPAQAREIMRQVPTAENQPLQEWESMRQRHEPLRISTSRSRPALVR
jgi:hypothetical protein